MGCTHTDNYQAMTLSERRPSEICSDGDVHHTPDWRSGQCVQCIAGEPQSDTVRMMHEGKA